jgi:hypothetical protein
MLKEFKGNLALLSNIEVLSLHRLASSLCVKYPNDIGCIEHLNCIEEEIILRMNEKQVMFSLN